jgi:hypothetical protein
MPETLGVFLTPKEAAEMLKVSVSYLRNSDCPKVLLPTQGKRAIVRYNRVEVEGWAEKFAARAGDVPMRRAS